VRQLPDKTEIFIELPRKPHVCPCCGYQTSYGLYNKCWGVTNRPAKKEQKSRAYSMKNL
jgi:hypothetical protein